MRDPYAVLGVAKTASEKDIKSAFRKLAKKYHPDANSNDSSASARFNEANQAYEILGDKDKRTQFDRGEIGPDGKSKFQGFPGGTSSPFGGAGGGRGPAGFDFRSSRGGAEEAGTDGLFSDFFEQAFGGRGGRAGGFSQARGGGGAAVKGEDIKATLKVRLEDIVSDDKVEAIFPTGKRLAIDVPDGVDNGQVIRLRGQGQPSPLPGGTPGDAFVTIEYVSHPRFEVAGRDLTLDLPVPVATAVLGGKVPVETLDGRISLTLPPWSNSGRTMRLKGKGLTKPGGGRGDILASIRIVLPKDPDPTLVDFFRAKVEPAES